MRSLRHAKSFALTMSLSESWKRKAVQKATPNATKSASLMRMRGKSMVYRVEGESSCMVCRDEEVASLLCL